MEKFCRIPLVYLWRKSEFYKGETGEGGGGCCEPPQLAGFFIMGALRSYQIFSPSIKDFPLAIVS